MYRMIQLAEYSAFMNMALDEAICEAVRQGESPSTIRFYTWKPSAISIGYFQGLLNEVNIEACRQAGVDIVRRMTGGGAVYHDTNGEVTYSIIGPVDDFPKDIIKSYEAICSHIVTALKNLGINAYFHPINDIIVDGRKISGNAQTRRNGILLQHGTILYDVDVDRMFSLLKVSDQKIADKMIQSVKKRVTRVLDFGDISKERLVEELEKAFCEGREVQYGSYSEKELARAKELAKIRYETDEWNRMR
ncbi:MAG: biotin/lipoate A/B protein ligase family protein [Nanoarchaeota archaeon]